MRKNRLENRVPPPLIMLFCLLAIGLGSRLASPDATVSSAQSIWSTPYFLLGLLLIVAAWQKFYRAKTTINPLSPGQVSALVSDGVFAYTRNPMYLGMSLLILGQIILLGWVPGLVWLGLFMAYIHIFQIAPEERAMQLKFGQTYSDYCASVRRWL